MNDIIAAQRRYFNSGATRSTDFRRRMLARLEEAVRRHEAELLAALKADLNKTAFEGYETELALVLSELREARRELDRWARPRRVPTPLSQFPSRGFVYPEPYGTTLIMSPWNYPLQLTLCPLAAAMAAGCTAVVKPSAYAPAASAALARLLGETFSRHYIAVVEGGREENAALLDQKFDYIFFTGSPQVGRTVRPRRPDISPGDAELGGKSPVIVAPDADLDLTAKRLVWGNSSTRDRPVWPPTTYGCARSSGMRWWSGWAAISADFTVPPPWRGRTCPAS